MIERSADAVTVSGGNGDSFFETAWMTLIVISALGAAGNRLKDKV